MGAHIGWGTKFINNTLVASDQFKNRVGITTGKTTNYEVNGNSISGFRVGIELFGDTGLIANNIINCDTGIQPKLANNFIIENNELIGCSILCYQSEGNLIFRNKQVSAHGTYIIDIHVHYLPCDIIFVEKYQRYPEKSINQYFHEKRPKKLENSISGTLIRHDSKQERTRNDASQS